MAGVRLTDPTTQDPFVNSGTISGSYGVYGTVNAAWHVTNLGLIVGTAGDGVTLAAGGVVVNGATNVLAAEVTGAQTGVVIARRAGYVTNFGTISGRALAGVILAGGGAVINGSGADTAASIAGQLRGVVVEGGSGTVANYGTIAVISHVGAYNNGVGMSGGAAAILNRGLISGSSHGIQMNSGGTLVNGSTGASHAVVAGGFTGVAVFGAAGTVANTGTITGGEIGVQLEAGGSLTNGSSGDLAASIAGNSGVWVYASSGSVLNFGSIVARTNAGIQLFDGGNVINGDATNTLASITGYVNGIRASKGLVAITNFGTISGAYGSGIYLAGTPGCSVTNGSAGDTAALIAGGMSLEFQAGNSTLINFGTIHSGVLFRSVAAIHQADSLANAGTIVGPVTIGAAANRVTIDPGAVFGGKVTARAGAQNRLVLGSASNVGTVGGLGAQFLNFGVVQVDTGARWSLTGANTLAGGSTIVDSGTLTIAGSLAVGGDLALAGKGGVLALSSTGAVEIGTAHAAKAGRLIVDARATLAAVGTLRGAVTDSGVIVAGRAGLAFRGDASGSGVIGAGTVEINAHSILTAEDDLRVTHVTFLAGGRETLALASPGRASSLIAGFGATDTIDLINIIATGSFTNGTLTLTASQGGRAALHFAGSYSNANFVIGSDGHAGTAITFHP